MRAHRICHPSRGGPAWGHHNQSGLVRRAETKWGFLLGRGGDEIATLELRKFHCLVQSSQPFVSESAALWVDGRESSARAGDHLFRFDRLEMRDGECFDWRRMTSFSLSLCIYIIKGSRDWTVK